MALLTGQKLGPYEIIHGLGAGGMGEVYRARDTRLERTVAIKVLPEHLTASADSRQRFEREAKAISSLQHPHICVLHDIGHQEGVDFLVMECLEGETLAERLRRGALPLADALSVAVETAGALEKAHRAGIVHRDIKPGNIMLTKSGAKLMDFGLAKGVAMGAAAVSGSAPLLSAAMTMTSPSPQYSPLTSAGMLVGTVQYMAPEQLQGVEADARSDIFALGAVLYEMVTGRRAFEGKSQLSVATAILEKDAEPVSSVQAAAPAELDRVVAACLAKDPEQRFQCAADLQRALEWIEPARHAAAHPREASRLRTMISAGCAIAAVAAAAWGGWWWSGRQTTGNAIYAEIPPPEKMDFDATGDRGGMPVLSPQGDKMAFVAHGTSIPQALWVRRLGAERAQRLDGTEGARHPFWSPDGKNIGYFANGKLYAIPAAGGAITTIADAPNARGGSWGADDTIIFTKDFRNALERVSARGGSTPTDVTTLDPQKHTTHRWPWFLPDGRHFLYFATNHRVGRAADNGIYFGSLDSKDTHLVVATQAAAEYASGYLLYQLQSALVAQPFDPVQGKLSGQPVLLVSNIRYDAGVWRSVFAASQTGVLLYEAVAGQSGGTQQTWFDRSGKVLGRVGQKQLMLNSSLSPDGTRVVFMGGNAGAGQSSGTDIWTENLERGTQTRITFDTQQVMEPSWSPDGKLIVFTAAVGQGGGNFEIHTKAADGSGAEQTIVSEPHAYHYPAFTPDGKYITFIWGEGNQNSALWAVPLEGDHKLFTILQPPSQLSSIYNYQVSPDGKWLAYVSDESGQNELYLTRFPKADGKWQVTSSGSSYPVWSKDGKELFYKDLNDDFFVTAVATSGGAPAIGTPRRLFHATVSGVGIPFDVSKDGKRLLVNFAEEEGVTPLNVVVNWTAEVKKKF